MTETGQACWPPPLFRLLQGGRSGVCRHAPHIAKHRKPILLRRPLLQGHRLPHTPPRYVWPIALSRQGLTSASQEEKAELLDNMVSIDAGTHLMHEGIDVDDPAQFTRPWFSWSNMMFCELVMDYFGICIKQ